MAIKKIVSFGKSDVELLSIEPLYKGFFKLNQYNFRYRLFNGSMSELVQREIFERGHAVALLPYDVKNDQIVLVEQIRIAAIETSDSPWQLELIAGIIEPGESLEDVIKREALEEAAVQVQRHKPIYNYLASAGGSTERIYIYIGQVDSSTAFGIHGLEEENEDIKVHVVPREVAWEWVENGTIENAATIIAIQWLQLHLEQIRQEWNA